MANLNGIAGDMVGQIFTGMLNRFDPFVDELSEYRQAMKALKDGDITLDQVQILETGKLRILPPPPKMESGSGSCVEEVTEKMKPPKKADNGSS